jgi:hypothetical protein
MINFMGILIFWDSQWLGTSTLADMSITPGTFVVTPKNLQGLQPLGEYDFFRNFKLEICPQKRETCTSCDIGPFCVSFQFLCLCYIVIIIELELTDSRIDNEKQAVTGNNKEHQTQRN